MDAAPKPKKKPEPHPPEEKKALGGQLKAAREAAGFDTQVKAAKKLEVVKQTVNQWETGKNLPDAIWLRRLARAYKTTADELLGNSAGGWPFSKELLSKVRSVDPHDLQPLEDVMWAHLGALDERPKRHQPAEDPKATVAPPKDAKLGQEIVESFAETYEKAVNPPSDGANSDTSTDDVGRR